MDFCGLGGLVESLVYKFDGVKSLRKFLLGRQMKRCRGAPPAPAVEYISPAPAVLQASPVDYIAPVPAVIQTPTSAVEYITPVPCFKRQRQWWSLLHLCLRCFTRQCSSLSLRMHRTRLRLKTSTRAPGSRCQCHQVFYTGRECGALEPGKRDADRVSWSRTSGWSPRWVGSCPVASQGSCSAWVCVAAAATCRAAFFVTSSMRASWWKCWRGLAVRAFLGCGEGAGARVAVRSVLEDHETAILELERQVCEVEFLVNHVKTLNLLVMQLQDTTFQTRDMSRTVAELGMKLETRVERQVSVVVMLETRVQETQKVGGGP